MVFSDDSNSQNSEETKTEFVLFPTSPDQNLNKTTIDNPQLQQDSIPECNRSHESDGLKNTLDSMLLNENTIPLRQTSKQLTATDPPKKVDLTQLMINVNNKSQVHPADLLKSK